MEMLNRQQVSQFINNAMQNGQAVYSVKGEPPKGACYEDGGLIDRPVNIKWINETTNESIDIIYEV